MDVKYPLSLVNCDALVGIAVLSALVFKSSFVAYPDKSTSPPLKDASAILFCT